MKECHSLKRSVDTQVMLSHWIDFSWKESNEEYFSEVEQASILSLEHKYKINEIYKSLPGSLPIAYHNWRYQIIVANAEECKKALFDHGLYCSNHYMSLCNGYFYNMLTPVCDYLESHIINLFNDFCYTEEQAVKTSYLLKKKIIPIY